ncbi:STAS domain-containing protein [Priestia aryabhattai]|uniref:RsbT co-antagonist protein RsbRA n=1 Tax=Priestia aryabhattai TaxID=412384 RepID=UPI00203BD165|nr:RsbT co-antagonist protein RsbRA [Priestia aryabhattai]MCM3774185.1 STAS domain-containing protein [Priestia aryabhattai]
MNQDLFNYIQNHKSEIFDRWLVLMNDVETERIKNIVSEQVYVNVSSDFVNLLLAKAFRDQENFAEELEEVVGRVVSLGWPLAYLTQGVRNLGHVVVEGYVNSEHVKADQTHPELFYRFDKWLSPIYNKIVEQYSNSWENTVMLQKVALQELSAPLIPVFDKITVMPLVGTIDTDRAKKIMENLLQGVVKHRSEVVLIDITGVPVVDTMVAHHIIQAAEAVRLVGAKCLLVGIRPEIAQTIVNLGINLNEIITKNSLKKGVEFALEMTERKIVDIESEE